MDQDVCQTARMLKAPGQDDRMEARSWTRWATVCSECLSAVCDAPAYLSRWSKLFMLAKCVLASPATGHRLRWREILPLVKSRIDRWLAGDLRLLWLEAVAGGKTLSRRVQSSTGS